MQVIQPLGSVPQAPVRWTAPRQASGDRFEASEPSDFQTTLDRLKSAGQEPDVPDALAQLKGHQATRLAASKLEQWDPGDPAAALQQLLAQPTAQSPDELRCLARCICDTVESRDAALQDLMPERHAYSQPLSSPGRSAVFRLCMEDPERPQFELDLLQELARLHAKSSSESFQKNMLRDACTVAAPIFAQRSPMAVELLKTARPTPVELLKAVKTSLEQPDNLPQLASLLLPQGDMAPMWQALSGYPAMVAVAAPLTALDVPPEVRTTIAQTALGMADQDPDSITAAILNAVAPIPGALVTVERGLLQLSSAPAAALALKVADSCSAPVQKAFYEAALYEPRASAPHELVQMLAGGIGRLGPGEQAPVAEIWQAVGELMPDFAGSARELADMIKSETLQLRLMNALLSDPQRRPLDVAVEMLGNKLIHGPQERDEAATLHQALSLRQGRGGIQEQTGRVLVGGTVLRRRT